MKRILLSLSMLTMVGAIGVIGYTGAFFTDAQTSANNIFTAGSVQLLIDHSLSTYNGVSDMTIVTDPTWTFVEDDGLGSASGNASNLTFVHPAWETIAGANWIWATNPVSDPANPTTDQAYTFTKTFSWTGPIASASVDFGADNYYDLTINGHAIGSNHSLIADNFQNPHTTDVTAFIVQGVNTITFRGENQHIDNSDFNSNPAGIDLKLVIHGQQTFGPTTLTDQKFFDFDDVKPQDTGRDVISIHDPGNDAWTCLIIDNVQNNENTLIAPEVADGDITPGDGAGMGGGELGNYLHIFLWHDLNGDGNYDPAGGETALTTTPITLTGTTTVALHDSGTGNGPILSGADEDIGSAWCAGTLTADSGTGAITCDGTSVGNDSQTDSTLADLMFYATQARNQPNFSCSSVASTTTN
jgi:hypothetical protein